MNVTSCCSALLSGIGEDVSREGVQAVEHKIEEEENLGSLSPSSSSGSSSSEESSDGFDTKAVRF